jgi:hypothetical protein
MNNCQIYANYVTMWPLFIMEIKHSLYIKKKNLLKTNKLYLVIFCGDIFVPFFNNKYRNS